MMRGLLILIPKQICKAVHNCDRHLMNAFNYMSAELDIEIHIYTVYTYIC